MELSHVIAIFLKNSLKQVIHAEYDIVDDNIYIYFCCKIIVTYASIYVSLHLVTYCTGNDSHVCACMNTNILCI